MEALSKYAARWGWRVTVITTRKVAADGNHTEKKPDGVELIELDAFGRFRPSVRPADAEQDLRSQPAGFKRRLKTLVQDVLGQVPDPRIPFALAFASPWLDERVKAAIRSADVVVGTQPPWPPMLAAVFCKARFRKPIVLDYRDPLSNCHEMRGGRFAKALELWLDRFLIRRANAVVTVSEPMSAYYSGLFPEVHTILNGYDPERIEAAKSAVQGPPAREGRPLVIRYLGVITPGRIPNQLLAALQKLHDQGTNLSSRVRFEYYGEWLGLVRELDERYPALKPLFSFFGFVPYEESLRLIVTADHLLFCENQVRAAEGRESSASGVLTTKMFEYVASGRPILADISPETMAGSFIVKSSPMHFVSASTEDHIRYLQSDAFLNPATVEATPFVATLSREAQSRAYVHLLGSIAGRAASRRGSAFLPANLSLSGPQSGTYRSQ